MFLKPVKLGEKEIPESILSEDKKHCKKIGPCGIGKEASIPQQLLSGAALLHPGIFRLPCL